MATDSPKGRIDSGRGRETSGTASRPLLDATRPGTPLVLLQQEGDHVLWPVVRIARLRVEWEGRLEALDGEGQLAHRPGPLSTFHQPPLLEVTPGVLVHPAYATLKEGELHLPGAWRLPGVALPVASLPPLPDPNVVLAALRRDRRYTLLTLAGEIRGPATRPEALRAWPDLLPAGPHLVRPGAIRRIPRTRSSGRVVLEGGHELDLGLKALRKLDERLGLPWTLSPRHRRVFTLGLRDWPEELLRTADPALRERYGEHPRRLVADVIWEAYRRDSRHATEHRGLYYNPLKVLAFRAGVLGPREAEVQPRVAGLPAPALRILRASLPRQGADWIARRSSRVRWDADRLWLELLGRLDEFVGQARLFTYRELGFVDKGQCDRLVGHERPETILLVEKGSLQPDARRVAEMFGVSMLVLGGFPTWIATEFFAEHLRKAMEGPVDLVSYCDHDPFGWAFPEFFARQLARYGVRTRGLVRLVKPSCFTAEELERLAVDLPTHPTHPSQRSRIEAWVRESGGVEGRPQGLYADFLRPAARLAEAFRRETGLEPVRPLEDAPA